MKASTEILNLSSPVAAHSCGLRCDCGSLLAKRVPGGVELKCRRCKTMTVVPLEDDWQSVGL